jgi:hypothetical protein
MPLSQCMLIDLQKMADPRGNLVFIEANQHIPFPIKRIYYLYDIPANATRAGHGHKGLYICPMVWREIDNFSPDAVCLVLASLHYDEEDYYREYSDFSNATRLS